MAVHGAAAACARGTLLLLMLSSLAVTHNQRYDNSIVRAFLIEEAKVVKRVIKSQQKAASGRS
jgi:hypothetical protein